MLSHHHRTIFVHIPKTGGQSIETMFLRDLGLTWDQRAPLLLRPNSDPARGPERLAHLYADEYVAFGYVTPQDFAQYFKFAVVRNPWDRAISQYKFAYQQNMSFADYVDNVIVGRRALSERHVAPQYRFVFDGNGVCLVDRLLRFERLADEFPDLSQKIFRERRPLSAVNVSRDRTDYRRFYDERTAAAVADAFRQDIDAFGYTFEPSAGGA